MIVVFKPNTTHAQKEHANPMQKNPRSGFEPRTLLMPGNSINCTTMQARTMLKQVKVCNISEMNGLFPLHAHACELTQKTHSH